MSALDLCQRLTAETEAVPIQLNWAIIRTSSNKRRKLGAAADLPEAAEGSPAQDLPYTGSIDLQLPNFPA